MPQSKQEKAARMAKWYQTNRDAQLLKMRQRREHIKNLVYEAYGGPICKCCGELNKKFLTIDHVNNDGAPHRQEIGTRGGIGWYYWLVENNFPPGFQVLCYNCNLGRARNKGICPHKEIDMAKYRANPLGHLMAELIQDKSNISGFSSPSGYDNLIRDQVPVKDGLAGQDTFKMDASDPSSRADVELRRMHVLSMPDGGDIGGGKLTGVNMFKEFGGGTGGSGKEFTEDKSA